MVVATHPRDGVIGAIILTAMQFNSQHAMFLDAIVVSPSWRAHGLGSVLLLTAQQLLPSAPSFAAGHCDPAVAGFFSQAGYTVLLPGVPLAMPFGDKPRPVDVGSDHSWFYRQGPI
ncbi:MAG: GNAT family N-acetyltransferase [Dermatophilaceae bacterium]